MLSTTTHLLSIIFGLFCATKMLMSSFHSMLQRVDVDLFGGVNSQRYRFKNTSFSELAPANQPNKQNDSYLLSDPTYSYTTTFLLVASQHEILSGSKSIARFLVGCSGLCEPSAQAHGTLFENVWVPECQRFCERTNGSLS